MINTRAFIYLIITLLIGFALGLFSGGLHHLKKNQKEGKPGPRFVVTEMLARDLQLTDAQMEETREIFAQYEAKVQKRREEIQTQVEADLESLKSELMPLLTKEQAEKLDRWIEGGMPPGPGPGNPRPGEFPPPREGQLQGPGQGPMPPDRKGQLPDSALHPPSQGERPPAPDSRPGN